MAQEQVARWTIPELAQLWRNVFTMYVVELAAGQRWMSDRWRAENADLLRSIDAELARRGVTGIDDSYAAAFAGQRQPSQDEIDWWIELTGGGARENA